MGRVARSLVLCVCFVDRCLSFCTFYFSHRVVCSSIYGFWWLPICSLQTFHMYENKSQWSNYYWNIVESGVKHHNSPFFAEYSTVFTFTTFFIFILSSHLFVITLKIQTYFFFNCITIYINRVNALWNSLIIVICFHTYEKFVESKWVIIRIRK
jgi:hypothetical protein